MDRRSLRDQLVIVALVHVFKAGVAEQGFVDASVMEELLKGDFAMKVREYIVVSRRLEEALESSSWVVIR